MKSAKDAGIQVILFDRSIDTDESNYQAALLSDMAYEGEKAVEWVLGLDLDEINLILIRGQMGSAAEIGRSAAVLDAAKAGKLNIVADGTGGDSWSLEEARKVVEAAIAAGKDFNVIYAQNDGMAQGAVQALQAAGISHGKGGKVKIIGLTSTDLHSETYRLATGMPICNAIHARQLRFPNGLRVGICLVELSTRKSCS